MYKETHTITTLIDPIKKKGLVETNRREEKRTFVDITLIDKGRAKVKEAVPIAEAITQQIIYSLNE